MANLYMFKFLKKFITLKYIFSLMLHKILSLALNTLVQSFLPLSEAEMKNFCKLSLLGSAALTWLPLYLELIQIFIVHDHFDSVEDPEVITRF